MNINRLYVAQALSFRVAFPLKGNVCIDVACRYRLHIKELLVIITRGSPALVKKTFLIAETVEQVEQKCGFVWLCYSGGRLQLQCCGQSVGAGGKGCWRQRLGVERTTDFSD